MSFHCEISRWMHLFLKSQLEGIGAVSNTDLIFIRDCSGVSGVLLHTLSPEFLAQESADEFQGKGKPFLTLSSWGGLGWEAPIQIWKYGVRIGK